MGYQDCTDYEAYMLPAIPYVNADHGDNSADKEAPDPTGSKLRSYGENPFGPTPLPQAEDCLNLNV